MRQSGIYIGNSPLNSRTNTVTERHSGPLTPARTMLTNLTFNAIAEGDGIRLNMYTSQYSSTSNTVLQFVYSLGALYLPTVPPRARPPVQGPQSNAHAPMQLFFVWIFSSRKRVIEQSFRPCVEGRIGVWLAKGAPRADLAPETLRQAAPTNESEWLANSNCSRNILVSEKFEGPHLFYSPIRYGE